MTTFGRACPVSLSRKPLSPGIEATPKTDLSLSRSLVHRQTWRLTGDNDNMIMNMTVSSLQGTLSVQIKFCHSTGIARSGGGVRASTTSLYA